MSETHFDPVFLSRLEHVDWFAHCGEPLQVPAGMRIHQLASLRLAVKAYRKQTWEDTTLEARNALALYISGVSPERYSFWNDTTRAAKAYMKEKLEPEWVKFQVQQGLEQSFIHSVR